MDISKKIDELIDAGDAATLGGALNQALQHLDRN